MVIKHIYSTHIYSSLIVIISGSSTIGGVPPHMTQISRIIVF